MNSGCFEEVGITFAGVSVLVACRGLVPSVAAGHGGGDGGGAGGAPA